MFDAALRVRLQAPLARAAAAVDRPGITPDRLTVAGLVLGLASAGLAAGALWGWAVAAWLVSRLLDGLDGALARRRAAGGSAPGSPAGSSAGSQGAGGFLDITADFVVYGAGVLGVAVGSVPASASLGDWLPFAAVLLAYYVNGAALLAFSSIAERTGHRLDDGRSLSFIGGLAEGAETIAVHTIWMLLPAHAAPVATVWAAVVGAGAAQRMVGGYRTLRGPVAG